jgi:DNA mismatch repair protein MSH6
MQSRKKVDYAESDDDQDKPLRPVDGNGRSRRLAKRAKLSDESDDEFAFDAAMELSTEDLGNVSSKQITGLTVEDDFVVPDDEDEAPVSRKKKRVQSKAKSPASPAVSDSERPDEMEDIELGERTSTANQWTYDPETSTTASVRKPQPQRPTNSTQKPKQKAHATEPEQRYPWLANLKDAERRSPDHPDYDPRTVYIPPGAWNKFSPFEKQYWDIKKNLWDTVVFFKKGKFYELYENDATIGHQRFELKLTDRVNMRMVGVPESSLDYWANRFVAAGYKIARVDQLETALGKEMRERDGSESKSKADKIIRRELAGILTGGTLVEGSMLQDDMATYCMAIKVFSHLLVVYLTSLGTTS